MDNGINRRALEQMMFKAFDKITPMPEELFKEFAAELRLESYPKNHVLLSAGSLSEASYFLLSGLVRFHYTTEDGQEFNKAFYNEGQIVGALSSIILKEPSRYTIETLEPCQVFVVPDQVYASYGKKNLAWERLFSHCCQMMLVRNERREAELLLRAPKNRYIQFVRNFPDLTQRISQYHIASYLGITPVALSRSRAKWDEELETP